MLSATTLMGLPWSAFGQLATRCTLGDATGLRAPDHRNIGTPGDAPMGWHANRSRLGTPARAGDAPSVMRGSVGVWGTPARARRRLYRTGYYIHHRIGILHVATAAPWDRLIGGGPATAGASRPRISGIAGIDISVTRRSPLPHRPLRGKYNERPLDGAIALWVSAFEGARHNYNTSFPSARLRQRDLRQISHFRQAGGVPIGIGRPSESPSDGLYSPRSRRSSSSSSRLRASASATRVSASIQAALSPSRVTMWRPVWGSYHSSWPSCHRMLRFRTSLWP